MASTGVDSADVMRLRHSTVGGEGDARQRNGSRKSSVTATAGPRSGLEEEGDDDGDWDPFDGPSPADRPRGQNDIVEDSSVLPVTTRYNPRAVDDIHGIVKPSSQPSLPPQKAAMRQPASDPAPQPPTIPRLNIPSNSDLGAELPPQRAPPIMSPTSANSGSSLSARQILVASNRIPPSAERLLVEARDHLLEAIARPGSSTAGSADAAAAPAPAPSIENGITLTLRRFLDGFLDLIGFDDLRASVTARTDRDRQKEETHRSEKAAFQEMLAAYKTRVGDVNDRLRRNDMQLDVLRGQLARREQQLLRQRRDFLRELNVLREQVIQAAKLGDKYRPDWMTFSDWSRDATMDDDNAAEMAASGIGAKQPTGLAASKGRSGGGSSTVPMVPEKDMLAMREKFEKELSQLKQRMKQEMEALQKQADDAFRAIRDMEEKFNAERDELRASHAQEMQGLRDEQEAAMDNLRTEMSEMEARLLQEKEEALDAQREQFENEMESLRSLAESVTEQLKAKTAAMEELQTNFAAETERIRRESETAMADMEAKFSQRIAELEAEAKEMRSAGEGVRLRVSWLQMQREDALSRVAILLADKAALEKKLEESTAAAAAAAARAANPAVEQILRDGFEKDAALASQLQSNNWGILKAHTKLAASQQQSTDPVGDLDVFTRLKERYSVMIRRMQEKREALLTERQRNMERVLGSTRMLVMPNTASSHSTGGLWRVPSAFLPSAQKSEEPHPPDRIWTSAKKVSKKQKGIGSTLQSTAPYFDHRRPRSSRSNSGVGQQQQRRQGRGRSSRAGADGSAGDLMDETSEDETYLEAEHDEDGGDSAGVAAVAADGDDGMLAGFGSDLDEPDEGSRRGFRSGGAAASRSASASSGRSGPRAVSAVKRASTVDRVAVPSLDFSRGGLVEVHVPHPPVSGSPHSSSGSTPSSAGHGKPHSHRLRTSSSSSLGSHPSRQPLHMQQVHPSGHIIPSSARAMGSSGSSSASRTDLNAMPPAERRQAVLDILYRGRMSSSVSSSSSSSSSLVTSTGRPPSAGSKGPLQVSSETEMMRLSGGVHPDVVRKLSLTPRF